MAITVTVLKMKYIWHVFIVAKYKECLSFLSLKVKDNPDKRV